MLQKLIHKTKKENARAALEEAEQRRVSIKKSKLPIEIGGRGGKDPVRYNDWEIKGRAIDF